jgi:hypothetical protein
MQRNFPDLYTSDQLAEASGTTPDTPNAQDAEHEVTDTTSGEHSRMAPSGR